MLRQVSFIFDEALRGIRRGGMSFWTSFLTVSISAFVLALLTLVFLFVNSFFISTPESHAIRVFVKPEFESADSLASIQKSLQSLQGMDSITPIDKTEALEEFKREYDPGFTEVLPYNPLPYSFVLHPSKGYRSGVQARIFENQIRLISGTESVQRASEYQNWIDKYKIPVWIGSLLALFFLSGAISLIVSNSIKLNLYARKLLVENMMYCGGSYLFISLPFLLEGLLIGAVGSLAGTGILYLCLSLLSSILFHHLGSPWIPAFYLALYVSILSGVTSFITVRRFLNKQGE